MDAEHEVVSANRLLLSVDVDCLHFHADGVRVVQILVSVALQKIALSGISGRACINYLGLDLGLGTYRMHSRYLLQGSAGLVL